MDGTKERKDTPETSLEGSSGGTKGTSKGKVYTDADIAKIKSDAAAEAGRLRKAAETERDSIKQELQSVLGRLDNLERERDESRFAEVRGNPDLLRAYQSEQSSTKRQRDIDTREREIARREAQVKADEEQLGKDRSFVHVAYTAAKHGLEVEDLESLGISDPEVLDKVAEKLAAGKGTTAKASTEGEEDFTPDSGEGIGGTGAKALTPESVEELSLPALEKQMKPPAK